MTSGAGPVTVVVLPSPDREDPRLDDTVASALDQGQAVQLAFVDAAGPTLQDALHQARGRAIAVVEAGDVWLPGAFALALATLDADAATDLVWADPCVVGRDGTIAARGTSPAGRPLPPSGTVIARPLVDRVDQLDPDDPWTGIVGASTGTRIRDPLVARPEPEPVEAPSPPRGLRQRLRPRRRARVQPVRTGWDIAGVGDHDPRVPLPPGAEESLRPDHPCLTDLRRRYEALGPPLCTQSFWAEEYLQRDLDLRWFRGDNAYVWQTRHLGTDPALRYELFARYLATVDTRGWLGGLEEDGAFGCWTFAGPGGRPVSRDLLDSVNEMCAIDRTWGLFDGRTFEVLDIGAGYGRLAHRMAAVTGELSAYHCVDGVPESTYLCGYYLAHRGVERAQSVPADQLDRLAGHAIDLAVNVHSFSETSVATIEAWLDLVVELDIPRLLVVPNDPDDLLSYEVDHSRREFMPSLEARGFRLRATEPVVRPDHLRRLIGLRDRFYFFERRAGA